MGHAEYRGRTFTVSPLPTPTLPTPATLRSRKSLADQHAVYVAGIDGQMCEGAPIAAAQKLLEPLCGPLSRANSASHWCLEGFRRIETQESVFYAIGRANRVAVDELIGAGALGGRALYARVD